MPIELSNADAKPHILNFQYMITTKLWRYYETRKIKINLNVNIIDLKKRLPNKSVFAWVRDSEH